MTSNTEETSHPTAHASDLIEPLADVLDAAMADDPGSVAVGIRPAGEDVDVVLCDLPDGSPDTLLGFVAPEDWTAFGIGAPATTRPTTTTRVQSADRRAGRLVLIADRAGNLSARLRLDGRLCPDLEAPTGPLADLCLRVMQAPTPPPDTSTMHLWALLWLDRIVADGAAARAEPSWRELARLCPGIEIGDAVFGTGPSEDDIVMLGRALSAGFDWEGLRQRQIDETGLLAEPTAEIAAWMDTGSFARATLALLPELSDLIDAADALTAGRTRKALTMVLRAWGVVSSDGSEVLPTQPDAHAPIVSL